MSIDTTVEQLMVVILQFAPILVILGVVAGVLRSLMHFGDSGYSSSSTPVEEEDVNSYDVEKRIRLEAEREIKMRFARGEITGEEYTSEMARL
jgi:uncharacterized membrane protein